MKSVNSMVRQLHALLGTNDLTEWEGNFIRSCWSRSEEGANTPRLTERQIEIIPHIYEKYFGGSI
jgi:hypothetical protein